MYEEKYYTQRAQHGSTDDSIDGYNYKDYFRKKAHKKPKSKRSAKPKTKCSCRR